MPIIGGIDATSGGGRRKIQKQQNTNNQITKNNNDIKNETQNTNYKQPQPQPQPQQQQQRSWCFNPVRVLYNRHQENAARLSRANPSKTRAVLASSPLALPPAARPHRPLPQGQRRAADGEAAGAVDTSIPEGAPLRPRVEIG